MEMQLRQRQKVRITGSRFAGSVGRVEDLVENRMNESMVSVRVWRVGPGVVLKRGETCLVARSDVVPAE